MSEELKLRSRSPKWAYYSIYILGEFRSLSLERHENTNSSVLWSRGLNVLKIFL